MSSKKHTQELGNKELYQRHLVAIEGGDRPKARVLDQHPFDRYLINADISLAQHQACEYLLRQAVSAGIFTRGKDFSGGGSTHFAPTTPSDNVEAFGRTVAIVKNKFGEHGSWLVQEVVLHNYDCSHDQDLFDKFKKCLSLIVEYRLQGGRNPLRHMRRGVHTR